MSVADVLSSGRGASEGFVLLFTSGSPRCRAMWSLATAKRRDPGGDS